jgi:hypothetical protein
MSSTRIIIVLFIVSEIPAAFYGAIGAWKSLSKTTGKRTIVGMLAGISLTIYGIARLMSLTTNMQYGAVISDCLREIEARSLVQAVTQAVPSWIFAFAFTGDDRPGVIRRGINTIVFKWR